MEDWGERKGGEWKMGERGARWRLGWEEGSRVEEWRRGGEQCEVKGDKD